MSLTKTTIQIPLLVPVLLVAVLVLGYQATASRFAPKRPAVVATVDLEALFEGLAERAAEDARLQGLASRIEQESNNKRQALTNKGTELSAMDPTSPRALEMQDELALGAIEYQAWVEYQRRYIEREKGLVMAKLYRSIKRSVEDMSKAEGLDIVFLNDSLKDIQGGDENMVVQQISARRMLFANPAIDITKDLMDRMNNSFKAGAR